MSMFYEQWEKVQLARCQWYVTESDVGKVMNVLQLATISFCVYITCMWVRILRKKISSHFLTLSLIWNFIFMMKKCTMNYTVSVVSTQVFSVPFKFPYVLPFSFTHAIFTAVVFANMMKTCWGYFIIFYMDHIVRKWK